MLPSKGSEPINYSCIHPPEAVVVNGLVFMQGENEVNETLLKRINESGRIHLVPSKLRGQFVLRVAICSRYTESRDVTFAWQEISSQADQLVGPNELI